MGSVRKILRTYGVGSKKYEAHKQNHNPYECHIQDIKCTTRTILDHSGVPIWSWILWMAYVFSILNCMDHLSLFWRTPHKAAYGFTTNVAHLIKFEFWEPILILDNKTQFPD